MSRRPVIVFVVMLLLLVGGSIVFIRSEKAASLLCAEIESRAGEAIDGSLTIDRCEVRLSDKEIVFAGVRAKSAPLGLSATIEAVVVRFHSWQSAGDMSLEGLDLIRPSLILDLSEERLDDGLEERGDGACSIPSAASRLAGGRIVDGEVKVLLWDGGFAEARGIEAEAARSGRRQKIHLSVAEGKVAYAGMEEPLNDLRAELEIDPASSTITVERSSISSADLSLTLAGVLEDTCNPDLEVSLTVDAAVARLADLFSFPKELIPAGGSIRLSATGGGTLDDVRLDASAQIMEGSLAPIILGDATIEGRVEDQEIIIDRAHTGAFGGSLEVSGTIGLAEGLPARLQVSGRRNSIAAVVTALAQPGSWVDATFSPTGSLTGTLYPLALSGPFSAPVDDFFLVERYASEGPPAPGEALLAFSNVRVEGEICFDDQEIRVPSARLFHGDTRLAVSGTFPLRDTEEMDVEVEMEPLFAEPIGPVVGAAYHGSVRGSLSLRGPYGSPRITADFSAADFSFQGLRAGRAAGRFRYASEVISLEDVTGRVGRTSYVMDRFSIELGAGAEPLLDIRVSVDDGYLEDVIEAFLDFDEVAADFVGVTGRVSGSVGLRGPAEDADLDFNAGASDGMLFDQPFRRARGMGRLVGMERFELDEITLGLAEDDAIVIRGWAKIEGPVALSLSAREVPSQSLFFTDDVPLTGLVSGDLVVEGHWDHPTGKGVGLLMDSRLGDTRVPPARLRLGLDGSRLSFSGHMVEDRVIGSGWIDLEEEHAFEVELDFDEPDVMSWLAGREGLDELGELRVAAAGRAGLSGLAPEPSTYQGLVAVESLELRWSPPPRWTDAGGSAGSAGSAGDEDLLVELSAAEPIELGVADGGLALARMILEGPLARLDLSGVRTASGELDLALHAEADLEVLESLVPQLEHVAGRLTVEAGVGGTVSSPSLMGSARLAGGELRVDDLPLSITELAGPLSFSRNRLIVDGMSASLGGGRVILDGEVVLDRFAPERFHLVASLDEVELRAPEELETTIAGSLLLTGSLEDLLLSGDLQVLRSRWAGEIEMDQILPNVRRRVAMVGPEVERDPIVDLDVRIIAPGNIRVDTRSARGVLAADLRLVGNDASPGLLGTIAVDEGAARFRGNEYTVTRGVVELQDRHSIDPWFDVLAESEIREYRVTVHAYGSPSDPRISISSDPPLAETDLVTLVALGITAQDSEAFGDSLAAAAAADALFAMSGLDRHVREFIPENPIVRDPSVRLTSGYSVRTGQVSPRLAFESSLFVEALRLRYSAPIGLPGQKTQAEYRITDVVSAQAEWDTEGRRTTSLGNLGVDLKLRWERD